ncbi:MAG: hypothetical protein Q9221_006987 [Calogaya cf. arnoldii]
MASACCKALAINELVSAVFSYLPKRDLKSACHVNKRFASIGGQMLIGTLYISPREIDMAAFDGITQHRDLSKSVKHVVYDSAQFKKLNNFDEYYQALDPNPDSEPELDFLYLGTARHKIRQFELKHCWSDPTFIEGYEHYVIYASECSNIFRPSWRARATRGLKALGQISSFAIENTWNAIYKADGDGHYEYNSPSELSKNPSESIRARLIDSGRILPDGRRLVGSPSARAWPPTGIPPSSPRPAQQRDSDELRDREKTEKALIIKTGISDGYWEFIHVLQVLLAANIMPHQFRAIKDFQHGGGLPLDALGSDSPITDKPSLNLANELEVFELHLDSPYFFGSFDCALLEQWLSKEGTTSSSSACQNDKLESSHYGDEDNLSDGRYGDMYNMRKGYKLTKIISNITDWFRPNLTTLHLKGFVVSFENLASLLFVVLPRLRSLKLGNFTLRFGIWEDIIEGIYQIVPLKFCELATPLDYPKPDGCYAPAGEDKIHWSDEQRPFMEANERYILEGGVHPRLDYVPSQEFVELIAAWKDLRSKNK